MLTKNGDESNIELKNKVLHNILEILDGQEYRFDHWQTHKYLVNGISIATELRKKEELQHLLELLDKVNDIKIKSAVCRDIVSIYDTERNAEVFNGLFYKNFIKIVEVIFNCVEYKDITEMYSLRLNGLELAKRFIVYIERCKSVDKTNFDYACLLSQISGVYDDISEKKEALPYIIAATEIINSRYEEYVKDIENWHAIAQEYNLMLFNLNRAKSYFKCDNNYQLEFEEAKQKAKQLCGGLSKDYLTFREFYDNAIGIYKRDLAYIFTKRENSEDIDNIINKELISLEGKYYGNLGQTEMSAQQYDSAMKYYEKSYEKKRGFIEILMNGDTSLADEFDRALNLIKCDKIDADAILEECKTLKGNIEKTVKEFKFDNGGQDTDFLYDAIISVGVVFKNIATAYFKLSTKEEDMNKKIQYLIRNYYSFLISIYTYSAKCGYNSDNKEMMISYNRMISSMIFRCILDSNEDKSKLIKCALGHYINCNPYLEQLADYREYIGGIKNGCMIAVMLNELGLTKDKEVIYNYSNVVKMLDESFKQKNKWINNVRDDVIEEISYDKNLREFIIKSNLERII